MHHYLKPLPHNTHKHRHGMVVASQAVDDQARNLCRAIDRGLRDWQGKMRESLLWTR